LHFSISVRLGQQLGQLVRGNILTGNIHISTIYRYNPEEDRGGDLPNKSTILSSLLTRRVLSRVLSNFSAKEQNDTLRRPQARDKGSYAALHPSGGHMGLGMA
jgi:hypothetical protein